ncbi:hypothetical protein P4H71_06815 [Paenibacillus kribbensis]|uniref:hypothetical protein n=1 Tax=Paenibacillus kribbensis TaxID=172713 RepID=UPI002DBAC95F|nr:hypothetical protein [Paenibacillus kribbensis]MEC0234041.1 hypothetical protein [Paenibacillus kribbensis]
MIYGYNPAPKPAHKRGRKKRGNHTAITSAVREEVDRRASEHTGYVVCERCGVSRPALWFEKAHLINASQYGSGSEPWNIANLCGPRSETGTCHQFADDTAVGREWKLHKRDELIEYYFRGSGREWWKGD